MTHSSPPHAPSRRPRAAALALGLAAYILFFPQPTAARRQTPPATTGTQEAAGAQAAVVIRWPGRAGVRRYRLQLATDEKFSDIVFDRAVEGRQHAVTELAPGVYYWRVAPAAAETNVFSRPVRVTVAPERATRAGASATSAGTVAGAGANLIVVDEATGWRTAVGEVSGLVGAKLRAGGVTDFVGVTANGRVFAVDGLSGVSLWNARTEAEAPAGFAPVVVAAGGGSANVLAGAGGGVRLLRGDTGREAWRARLEGTAAAGAVADLDGDGAGELIVATSNPPALYVLAQDTGRVVSTAKLGAETVGAPASFTAGGARGVLVALRDGTVQARGRDLSLVGSLKLDAALTTAPIMVGRGDISVVVVGSEGGLVALGFPEMRLLGRIVSEDDPVHGTLASADIDGDGSAEIAMVTRAGRVAVVGTNDGVVRWYAEGATGAGTAGFADINRDGVLDVIVPGGSAFLLGFSGRDGSLLMRADESGARAPATRGRGRPFVLAVSPAGGLMLVGADPGGTGLRAVELTGAVRAGSVKVGP
jgi:outer membrane protein assembly factor BamB